MTIHPDGTFNISEQTLICLKLINIINVSKSLKMQNEFCESTRIIRDALGNINIIKIQNGSPFLKYIVSKLNLITEHKVAWQRKRNELLSSCLDIKMFNDGVSEYYFVGTIGNGMRY